MGSQQCVKGVSVCGSILGTRARGPVSMHADEATVPMEKLTHPGSVRADGTQRAQGPQGAPRPGLLNSAQSGCA